MSVGPLKDSSGNLITDDLMMAEQLNIFFCSVFTNEDCNNLPEAENLIAGKDALEDCDITEEKVKAKLHRLKPNSAPGPDKLWPCVLQKLADVLSSCTTTCHCLYKVFGRGDSSSRLETCQCNSNLQEGVKGLCWEL